MTRTFISVCLVAALLCGPSVPLSADEVRPGTRITDLRVTGLRRVAEERVMQAIRLRKGDVFTPQAVDEDVRRLDELGFFYPTGISVRSESYEAGIRLTFELQERPVIGRLTFEGNRKFSDKKLRETVGLREGDFLDFAREKESTGKILQLYREKRYYFVEVARDQVVDEAANSVDITYTVNEGPQLTLTGIRFEGNQAFTEKRLLQEMETRARKWIFFAQTFDEQAWQLDLVRLRQFYKRHGYLDAVVTDDYIYSDDKSRLTLVVKITEGPRYTVGDVTLRGQTLFEGEELRKPLKLAPGGAFGADDYTHDIQSLRDHYTSRGYLDVKVEPKEVFPEPERIDIVYTITEGPQYRMGLLQVRGNYKTKDKVIRREFNLFPGDVFDAAAVNRGVAKLLRTRYFTNVETTLVDGEEPGEKDLVVEVEEGRTGNISFGAGVSSNDGLIGQFQISLENFDIADWPKSLDDLFRGEAFVGAGQRLLLQLRPGTELNQARLYFADPYIFDTKYAFSSDLYLYDRDRDDYTESRVGVRLGLGRSCTEHLSGKLTLRIEGVEIHDIDTTAPDVLLARGSNSINSLIFNLVYDRTNDYFQPSAGYRLDGSLEVAGDYLGSDYNFVKGIIEGRWYHELFRTRAGRQHILAVGARVGAVSAYGDSKYVPLYEKFYAGGRNSVRGFSYRGLGPTQAGTEVGGEFSFVGNVEYIFPLYQTVFQGREVEMIRGVLFFDMGQVAYELGDIGDTTWRMSVGAGLRFQIPMLGPTPIAIDFGFPVNKDDDDDTQVFSFSIGTVF